jgi:hypothetical protein
LNFLRHGRKPLPRASHGPYEALSSAHI